MSRLGFRLAGFALLAMIGLAGCGKDVEEFKPVKYDYNGPVDLIAVAKQFHDNPPEAKTRTVASDKMPLTFVDLDGKKVDLSAFKGKSNVVLVMTKGMPQAYNGAFCPGCLAQMNAMVANAAEFKKRDAEVLVVFPGPSEKANDFLITAKAREADKPSPIPLLLDKDMAAVTLLGINGDRAKPSTYILDRKGNVVYAYVGEHTTDRPSVKAILGQLDKLNEKKAAKE
ncbi:MAG: peroxiredoxin family protein [Planctomycetes bacterium]|nr:peroxiredoxin family protein [Planctomycetota bacterium]